MNKEEFLAELADTLQMDTTPAMDTVLKSLDRWDSLTMMVFIAYADARYGKKLVLASLGRAEIIEDLYRMVTE